MPVSSAHTANTVIHTSGFKKTKFSFKILGIETRTLGNSRILDKIFYSHAILIPLSARTFEVLNIGKKSKHRRNSSIAVILNKLLNFTNFEPQFL